VKLHLILSILLLAGLSKLALPPYGPTDSCTLASTSSPLTETEKVALAKSYICEQRMTPKSALARRESRDSFYELTRYRKNRTSKIENGFYVADVSMHYKVDYFSGNYSVEVVSQKTFAAPPNMQVEASGAQSDLEVAAERALKQVIQIYRDRREKWSPEFLAKLKKTAKEYLADSTYIYIKQPNGTDQPSFVAALRMIKERNGRLPMEEYLGIEIEAGDRIKMEPGNFAINKEFNQDAWPELLLQLLSLTSKNLDSNSKIQYITYADEYSLKLYSKLGFKPVDPKKIKVFGPHKMVDGKITVDGIDWTPMEASQEMIDGLYFKIIDRLADSEPDKVKLLETKRADLLKLEPQALEFKGRGTWSGKDSDFVLTVNTKGARRSFQVRIDPADYEHSNHLGSFNLKEPVLENKNIRANPSEAITYENGTLRIEKYNGDVINEISVTPDMNTITRVKTKFMEASF
jgi:hypothetical protein